MIRRLAVVLLIASLISCRTQPPQKPQEPQPLPEFPLEAYRPTIGASAYQIDRDHSLADIVVRRGGKLARYGHDHVVSAKHIDGYVLFAANEFLKSRADLRLALDSLIVDDAITREQFALDTKPTPQDIEKTSENMQGKVLQTDIWPQVHLKVEVTGGTPDTPQAQVTMYLHGEEHLFPITFNVEGLGEVRLTATGSFSLRQSDYGIQPFSILGGALQVLDQVDVTFRLVAKRLDSPVLIQPGN